MCFLAEQTEKKQCIWLNSTKSWMISEELIPVSSRSSNHKSSKYLRILNQILKETIISNFIHKCMDSRLCNKLKKKLWRSCFLIKSLRWTVSTKLFVKIILLIKCIKVKDYIRIIPLIFKIQANSLKTRELFNLLMIEKIFNILLTKTK